MQLEWAKMDFIWESYHKMKLPFFKGKRGKNPLKYGSENSLSLPNLPKGRDHQERRSLGLITLHYRALKTWRKL